MHALHLWLSAPRRPRSARQGACLVAQEGFGALGWWHASVGIPRAAEQEELQRRLREADVACSTSPAEQPISPRTIGNRESAEGPKRLFTILLVHLGVCTRAKGIHGLGSGPTTASVET